MPNVVMYLVGGAVIKEVESNVTGVDPITLDTGTELVAAALKPRRGVKGYWGLLKLPRQETQLSVLGTPSFVLCTTTVEGHGTY